MPKRLTVAGAFVLSAIVFVTYYPELRMGFYLDDYNYLERAGRTDWSNALVQVFDPRLQTLWYRPLQAIQFFIEYQLLGGNANAYHLVNIAFHAINVLLLGALVWRISEKWLLGFVSALFYSTFSVYMSGVSWIGIVDPLAAIFYLLSLWFWWAYLKKGDWQHYLLALGAFVLALMSKQVAVTIPVVFLLMDRLLVGGAISPARLLRRYSLFVVMAFVFAIIQFATQSTRTFAGVFGWQMGSSMAFILLQYLVLFFFPWGNFPSIDFNPVEVGDVRSYTWVVVAVVLLTYVMWRKRSRILLFLSAFTLLTLLPVLPFPFIEHRYLYIPVLPAAIFLGLLFDQAQALFGKRSWLTLLSSAGLALIVLGNGLVVNDSALAAAEWARQLRVPFRDIERQHPTFPQDTLLYFIDPITPTEGGLSGMFFLRYGRGVSVRGWHQEADLADHSSAYVYYFDESRRPRETPVEKNVAARVSPALPASFQIPIRLEGYAVARTTIKRGTPIILILYWRGTGAIDRNYTVFTHLVDANGRMVAGYDSQPRKGQAPTREWEPYRMVVDAILLAVDSDVPLGGGYKVEVGLYDQTTSQRLLIQDAGGQPITDTITIEPFIVE